MWEAKRFMLAEDILMGKEKPGVGKEFRWVISWPVKQPNTELYQSGIKWRTAGLYT